MSRQNFQDTEDGINEAAWEREMKKHRCERCHRDVPMTWPRHIDNGENGVEWLCTDCFHRVTDTGAYDPEHRDWDAERDLREADGDY